MVVSWLSNLKMNWKALVEVTNQFYCCPAGPLHVLTIPILLVIYVLHCPRRLLLRAYHAIISKNTEVNIIKVPVP